jgi:hypothetical protein
MRKHTPRPPDILRKSGPQKDRTKYDRKRVKEEDRREPPAEKPPDGEQSA